MSQKQVAIPSTTPLRRFTERLYPLGYPVTVKTNDPKALENLWGGWPQLVSGDALSVSMERASNSEPGRNQRERFRVTPTGFRLDGAANAMFDAPSLRLQIRTQDVFSEHFLNTALLTALDFSLFTPLHAACVAQNGSGVLLCGDSGAGKSTLAYACARRGWTLVSDDSLHAPPGLGPTVASFSSTIHLREPTRALFSDLHREPLTLAPNGKPALEIHSSQRGFRTARTASVERAVFLSRRPGPPRLTPFSPDAAVQYFSKYLWQPDLPLHQSRLREIVNHTGAELLEYDGVEETVDALEDLLKEKGMAA